MNREVALGNLIIIGGHEDKENERLILKEVASRVKPGTSLVVATLASHRAHGELWEDYRRIFGELGVASIRRLDMNSREQAFLPEFLDHLADASVVFFTGGDQLRITSHIGGTPVQERIIEIFHSGGTICGTSAGASMMSETMLVAGVSVQSHRVGSGLRMAPGLGLIRSMIVDQHFAERGRIGRLLGAVAQNPRFLGVGIDEDTAIVTEGETSFRVIGSGGVYIVDARRMKDSNISEARANEALSLSNVTLHLLSQGDEFHLVTGDVKISVRRDEERMAPADYSAVQRDTAASLLQ